MIERRTFAEHRLRLGRAVAGRSRARREPVRDRLGRWWESAVLDRWDRGVPERWHRALGERRDRVGDSLFHWWDRAVWAPLARLRGLDVDVPLRVTVGLVVVGAVAGSLVAAGTGPGGTSQDPRASVRHSLAPVEAQQSAAVARRLPAAVRRLDAARADGRRRLADSRTAGGQAAAAASVAHAYRSSADELAPFSRRDETGARATVRALRQAAAAYDALAGAARAGRAGRFSATRDRVTRAEADVRRVLRELSTRAG